MLCAAFKSSTAATGGSSSSRKHVGAHANQAQSNAKSATANHNEDRRKEPIKVLQRQLQPWTTNGRGPALDPDYGTAVVELHRQPNTKLGLGISGGADLNTVPTVSYLVPGSIAHRCDGLQVGDRLVSVNGIHVAELRHSDLMALLRNANGTILLQVEYDLTVIPMPNEKPSGLISRLADIRLEKEQHGTCGIVLRGGSWGPESPKSRPLTVTSIRLGGPADREGRLRMGDRLMAIDGADVATSTLSRALSLLSQKTSRFVALTVEYDILSPDVTQVGSGPFSVEIEKLAGAELGIRLEVISGNCFPQRSQKVIIKEVIPASTADRCGHLYAGDEILSINGTGLEFVSLAEAYQLLRGCCNSHLQLEVMPRNAHQIALFFANSGFPGNSILEQRRSSDQSERRNRRRDHLQAGSFKHNKRKAFSRESIPDSGCGKSLSSGIITGNGVLPSFPGSPAVGRARLESFQNGYQSDTALLVNSGINHHHQHHTSSYRYLNGRHPASGLTRRPFIKNGSVTASVSGVPCSQVCHSEVMEVALSTYARGTPGLILHRSPADHCSSPLFVSYIERGSPAEKCGVIQVGDRILAISDWVTSSQSAEEANHRLRQSQGSFNLTVEFDVIETVLPSSGVFTVKLAKRGQNLGLVLASTSGGSQKGEPVIVNEVRTGSVAHRCGSISAGDQILSIDNIPLDSCNIEEAARLLQRCSEIVKLRIRKRGPPGSAFDDCDAAVQTVVYSVELSRKGGPLGITIAGTEDRYDPIFISQLAVGGLAEKTGALHVGDRILAINGQSLASLRVSEAIQLLQQAGETVQLRIGRTVEPLARLRTNNFGAHHVLFNERFLDQDTSDKLGTPVQSIDSAVESLEDSPEQPGTSAAGHSTSNSQQDPGSNRHSHNSKSSSLSGGANGAQDPRFVEDLSRQLRRSLSSLRHLSQAESSSSGATELSHSIHGMTQAQLEWVRVLEALESVGEAEMLRKIEESILNGTVPACEPGCSSMLRGQTGSSPYSSRPASIVQLQQPHSFAITNTILKHPFQQLQNAAACGSGCSQNSAAEQHSPYANLHGSTLSITSSGSGGAANQTVIENCSCARPSTSAAVLAAVSSTSSTPCSLRNMLYQLPAACSSHNAPLAEPESCAPTPVSCLLATRDIPFITTPIPAASASGSHDGSATPTHVHSGSETPIAVSGAAAVGTHELPLLGKPSSSSNVTHQLPLEIHRVQLDKDMLYNDFGFSISDGVAEKGVFINKIRAGGPADRSGNIVPFDRLLQVNSTSVRELDCMLTVPLLAAAGDKIELLICRDPNVVSQPLQLQHIYSHSEDLEDDMHALLQTQAHEIRQTDV